MDSSCHGALPWVGSERLPPFFRATAIGGRRYSLPYGGAGSVLLSAELPMPDFRQAIQGIVTISVMGVALYAAVSPSVPPDSQRWAYGIIGTLLGFWLRRR